MFVCRPSTGISFVFRELCASLILLAFGRALYKKSLHAESGVPVENEFGAL